jgi:hypothetical protein
VSSYPITAAAGTLAASNYTFAFVNGTMSVTAATLTVTADNKSRAFGDANPALTASYSGFKNGETLATSGVTGTPTLTTTATTTSAVGSYAITATAGTLASANYTFTFVNGTLTINKATPTITWNNPADITVGTALSATQLNATASVAGTFVYTPPAGTVLNAGAGQTLSVTFTPTDTANYTNATRSVLINVNVNTQAPTTTSTPTSSLNPSTYGQSVTLTATVTSGSGTPAGSVQFLDGPTLLGTATLSGGTASLTTSGISAGTRSITAKYLGNTSFASSTSSVALTQTVNQATGTASLAASALTPVYSDMETFTASYTPGIANGPGPALANVIFKMGTQTLGPATSVTLVGGVYQYAWTGPMTEPTPFGTAPTGQMKPGSRAATAAFVDANFTITNPTKLLTIQKEDARLNYGGATTFSLGGSATGTVVLNLTVKDITAMIGDPAWDGNAGDIRNAQVQFWDRTANILLGTATVTATGDTATVGTATLNWSVNLGTATSKTFTIGFVVANYYNRNQAADNVNITVNK